MILVTLFFREFQEIGRFYIQCDWNYSLLQDISASFRWCDADSESGSLTKIRLTTDVIMLFTKGSFNLFLTE